MNSDFKQGDVMTKVKDLKAVCHFCKHHSGNDDPPCEAFPERKASDLYPNGPFLPSAFPDCEEFTS